MPLYEYKCAHCSLKFEILRSNSKKDDPAKCIECKKEAKRVLSAPEAQFNVPGFVASDFQDVDKVVGADAEKRWINVEHRRSDMMNVISKEKATNVARTSDGKYVPIRQSQAVTHVQNQRFGESVAPPVSLPAIVKKD